ncbi:MAG: hypothetical protein K5891_09730 [Lachnospiraceae bacterium]|nr:hypothetical protein [Lachnospiraceae bacterium]
MGQKIICKSCAAEFDANLVRCPYCGTAYAPAEEKEYMGKLEAVREDLHQEIQKGDRRIGKKMGRTVRNILIVIGVILLLVFGVLWITARSERAGSDRKKQEFLQNQGITTQQEVETDGM